MRAVVLAAFFALAIAHQPSRKSVSLVKAGTGAPGAAPGGAPGAAPAGSPAGPTDSWGADTHAEEFGKEYVHHTREGLKEPHVGDAAWQSEMHANPANFDPHGDDFLTDRRSPARPMLGDAGRVELGLTLLAPLLAALLWQ